VECVLYFNLRCNSMCPMCAVWTQNEKEQLDTEELKKLFAKFRHAGFLRVNFQGGEPLLRKDLLEAVEAAVSHGLKPIVITNAIMLKPETAEALFGAGCSIIVSLDTLNPETYRKIRGVDKLSEVFANLESAAKIAPKRKLAVNMTIHRLNAEEVEKIHDYAAKLGIGFTAYPYNYRIGIASAYKDELVLDKKTLEEKFRFLRDEAKKKYDYHYIIYDQILRYLGGENIGACDGGRLSIIVDNHGNLGPCIEFKAAIPVMEKNIDEALNLLDYPAIRKCYENTPCFYGCTRSAGILSKNYLKYALCRLYTFFRRS